MNFIHRRGTSGKRVVDDESDVDERYIFLIFLGNVELNVLEAPRFVEFGFSQLADETFVQFLTLLVHYARERYLKAGSSVLRNMTADFAYRSDRVPVQRRVARFPDDELLRHERYLLSKFLDDDSGTFEVRERDLSSIFICVSRYVESKHHTFFSCLPTVRRASLVLDDGHIHTRPFTDTFIMTPQTSRTCALCGNACLGYAYEREIMHVMHAACTLFVHAHDLGECGCVCAIRFHGLCAWGVGGGGAVSPESESAGVAGGMGKSAGSYDGYGTSADEADDDDQ